METLYKIIDFPATKWLILVFTFVMPLASLLTWADRRQSAMMQDRILGLNNLDQAADLVGRGTAERVREKGFADPDGPDDRDMRMGVEKA